jgi:hypothetical protein
VIEQPFLTLDGSTAPGAGITLKDSFLKILRTHDIIVRHLRVRPGDEAPLGKGAWLGKPQPNKSGDAISVAECADVIIDHVSASWSTDDAGATLPRRDAIDERIVRQYREGIGRVIDSQDEVGGYAAIGASR